MTEDSYRQEAEEAPDAAYAALAASENDEDRAFHAAPRAGHGRPSAAVSAWPLWGLKLKTAQLELRVPTDADLDELAALAVKGIHDPAVQPFGDAWTDLPPARLADSIRQWEWSRRGSWKPQDWTCAFAALRDGEVIGVQSLSGRDFQVLREVRTGSWLGLPFQRRGYGTEMRAAVLGLAFEELGAICARTTSHWDNVASMAVNRKLGYVANGSTRIVVRGKPMEERHFVLSASAWALNRTHVKVTGLDVCRSWFGLE